MNKVKDSLKILRVKAKLTQAELAKRSNLTQTSIARYEANNDLLRRASYETIECLADALGVEISDIDMSKKGSE